MSISKAGRVASRLGSTYNPRHSTSGVYLNNENDFVQLADDHGRKVDFRSWCLR